MRKNSLIYGYGVNDSEIPVNFRDEDGKLVRCPVYSTWKDCLRRTHGNIAGKKNLAHYMESAFDPCWKYFTDFREWASGKFVDGYQLDKDILFEGNVHYGPETCCFVPSKLNTCFRPNIKTSELGQGVRVKILRSGDLRYEAFANNFSTGKNVYLGLHQDLKYAQALARAYREVYLKDVLYYLERIEFKDQRVIVAIENKLHLIKSSL